MTTDDPPSPAARTLKRRGTIAPKTSAPQTSEIEVRATKTPAPERVAAFQTGLSAESKASAYLIAKGYRILARRFRTPYGEIDIVAKRRNLIAFIEVKARASFDAAAYSVTPQQQQRIVAAAQVWLMTHPEHADFEMRFDAILIAPKHLPKHLTAAFDAGA